VRSVIPSRRLGSQPWGQPRFFFPDIKTRSELGNMLVGTTWRKKNDLEHVIVHDPLTYYNNHAGHPTWRENRYSLGERLGSMTLTWSVDGLEVSCQFNEQFNEFVELANPGECVWAIVATKPFTPSWGI